MVCQSLTKVTERQQAVEGEAYQHCMLHPHLLLLLLSSMMCPAHLGCSGIWTLGHMVHLYQQLVRCSTK